MTTDVSSTWDSPLSGGNSAQQVAHCVETSSFDSLSAISTLKCPPAQDYSSTVLSNLSGLCVSSCKTPSSYLFMSPQESHTQDPFPIFRLPLRLREQIYSYIVGRDQLLHIVLKRQPVTTDFVLGYRRCTEKPSFEHVRGEKCRAQSTLGGRYSGWFDNWGCGIVNLLLSSKQM